MKKKYITPRSYNYNLEIESLLAISGDIKEKETDPNEGEDGPEAGAKANGTIWGFMEED